MRIPRPLTERAPAKINLTLRIVGRRADGYHLLDSLVAFAAVSDELRLIPGKALSLSVRGPTAAAAGPDEQNLVLRAVRALAERVHGLELGQFALLKRLPVAAGIGGGSSDAAGALRLLARINGIALGDSRLVDAAMATGADVPVCLSPTARRMSGAGEALSKSIEIPRVPAILVNPGTSTPTAKVFAARGGAFSAPDPVLPEGLAPREFLAFLAASSNDLEEAASLVSPAIGDVLARVAEQRGCLLARMSGSGATVFGLFGSCRSAAGAAKAIRAARPGWWVRTTMIGSEIATANAMGDNTGGETQHG